MMNLNKELYETFAQMFIKYLHRFLLNICSGLFNICSEIFYSDLKVILGLFEIFSRGLFIKLLKL